MSSLNVKLPITRNDVDGFTMIKDLKSLLNQNLKMIILTNPGERVMDPNFGVGINAYLFENFNNSIYTDIRNRILEQVSVYLPVITIDSITFDGSKEEQNLLGISISYSIPSIGVKDLLEFTI
jgi:phage baseplate assembly protein W